MELSGVAKLPNIAGLGNRYLGIRNQGIRERKNRLSREFAVEVWLPRIPLSFPH